MGNYSSYFFMYTLSEFQKQFPDDDSCLKYIYERKYKNKKCPKCKKIGAFYKNNTYPCYTCSCGQYHLYPSKGTIFQDSKLGLQTWFTIVFLSSKITPSPKEIETFTGISHVTTCRIQRVLLELMAKNIDDKTHLSQWKVKIPVKRLGRIEPENLDLYLSAFQFQHEQEKRKSEPFFYLLDLCMNV